jgi:hypothetical protein
MKPEIAEVTEAEQVEAPAGLRRMTFAVEASAPERLSMSYVRNAENCLRMAAADRRARVSGVPATVGTVFHDCAAAIGTATVMAGRTEPDLDRVPAITRGVIQRPDQFEPLPREAWTDVLELVDKWSASVSFHPESQFEVSSRITIAGRTHSARLDVVAFDANSATVFLDDWKTGRGLPGADEPATQGEIYALHAHSMFPDAERFVFRERFVRLGIDLEPFVLLDADLEETADWLADTASRIDRAYDDADDVDSLPASPGKHCAYCPAKASCPIPAEARPASELETIDDATEQLEAILVAQAQVEERKGAVRAFLEANEIEAVEAGGKRLGFTTAETKRLDKKAAEAAGVNLDDFRKVSTATRFSITNAKADE